MASTKPVMGSPYRGPRVDRGKPDNLPPQAKARLHSQWDRCRESYQDAWRFELEGEPPTEDEYESYTEQCDGFVPGNYGTKIYVRDGELTIMQRTERVPAPGDPGFPALGQGQRR